MSLITDDDLQDNDLSRYQVPIKEIMIIFIIIISIIIMKFYARENELILMKQLKNSAPSFLVITG